LQAKLREKTMTLYFPDALASINALMFTDSKTYTKEAQFLVGTVNRFICMGGPNYSTDTTRILDALVEEYGYRETVRFLYLIKKICYSDLGTNTNYAYLWDWFKNCRENLSIFKREVEERAAKTDASKFASVIPDSIRREFGE
jgi:hypothetical protein